MGNSGNDAGRSSTGIMHGSFEPPSGTGPILHMLPVHIKKIIHNRWAFKIVPTSQSDGNRDVQNDYLQWQLQQGLDQIRNAVASMVCYHTAVRSSGLALRSVLKGKPHWTSPWKDKALLREDCVGGFKELRHTPSYHSWAELLKNQRIQDSTQGELLELRHSVAHSRQEWQVGCLRTLLFGPCTLRAFNAVASSSVRCA